MMKRLWQAEHVRMALVPAVTITSLVIVTPILTPEKGGSEAEKNSKNSSRITSWTQMDSNLHKWWGEPICRLQGFQEVAISPNDESPGWHWQV